MNTQIVDCLVCKFESDGEDKVLYVLYDTKRQNFILRGMCSTSGSLSFQCQTSLRILDEEINILQEFICQFFKDYKIKTNLLNYRILPYDPKNITFHYLNKFKYKNINENSIVTDKCEILRMLKIIKNVTNNY